MDLHARVTDGNYGGYYLLSSNQRSRLQRGQRKKDPQQVMGREAKKEDCYEVRSIN